MRIMWEFCQVSGRDRAGIVNKIGKKVKIISDNTYFLLDKVMQSVIYL